MRRSPFRLESLEPRLALATIQGTLTADNHYGLFTGSADGSRISGLIGRNEVGASGSPGDCNWSLPETFSWAADPNDRLYVAAWDDGLWQGLIGQFTVTPSGGDCAPGTIVTNATDWECALGVGSNPGPNGPVPDISRDIPVAAWKAIGQAADNGSAPWGAIQGISAKARFIWYDSLGSETVPSDARYTIYRTARSIKELLTPPPTPATPTASATLTADNHYGLFTGPADGSSLSFIGRNEIGVSGNPGTWNWSLPESWTFTPAAGEHIYVVAWDDGGPQSWIGQFTLPDGTMLVSNAQDWEAVVGPGPNPGPNGQVPSADVFCRRIQAATWQSVGASAVNGSSPWGKIPGIGSTEVDPGFRAP